jgi:hypothetical protein
MVSSSLGRIIGFGGSVFFARTHELLQYHFRTVALAFEYDKDGLAIAERLGGCPFLRDGMGLRGPETFEAYFVRNHCAFSEPRSHR